MSRLIRYGLADEHLGRIFPKEDGHLVMHSDYAALQAQLDRLKKAGDALEVRRYIVDSCKRSTESEEWERAKKGLPSAQQQSDREKVARLDAWNDSLICENARLKAQLERLRAAGDQMLGTMLWAAAKNPDGPAEKRILAWINARDGNEEAAK